MGDYLTHTVSGDIASFKSADIMPIESLKCHFLPTQEGSGDPSPTNIRNINGWTNINVTHCGKNLINEDNMTVVRGYIRGDDGTEKTSSTSFYISTLISVKPLTGYSITIASIHDNTRLYFLKKDGTWIARSAAYSTISNNYTVYIYTPANCELVQIQFANTADISILQVAENYITTHESYCGQTIPITFPTLGKNKINLAIVDGREGITYNNGTVIGTAANIYNCMGKNVEDRLSVYIPANTVFSISMNAYTEGNQSTSKIGLALYAGHPDGTGYELFKINNNVTTDTQFTFTGSFTKDVTEITFGYYQIDNNIWHISNLQLEYGDTVTAYEPYDSNNTVYGGYIDLITGTLVQTWNMITVTSNKIDTITWTDSNANIRLNIPNASIYSGGNTRYTAIISHWINSLNTNLSYAVYCGYSSTNNQLSVVIGKTWLTDRGYTANETGIRNFLNDQENNNTPLQIAYPLTTPIVYHLNKYYVKTLLGQNHIWSNTYSNTEVTYAFQDHLLQQRMLIKQPHIETASGSIVSFNTDMKAPLKSAKFYFNPIQEGTGDPSPENVRAIKGWEDITIHQSGKNFFDINLLAGTNITITDGIAVATGGYFHSNFGDAAGKGVPLDIDFGTSQWKLSMSTYTNGEQALEHTVGLYIYFDYADGTKSGYVCYNDETTFTNHIFTSAANKILSRIRFSYSQKGSNIWHVKNIHLEPINTFTEYEPYQGQTLNINWTSNGTLYGGYIDLVTGELVATYYYFIADENCNMYTYGADTYNGTQACNRCIGLPYNASIRHLSQQSTVLLYGDKINCYTTTYNWHNPDNCIWQACINAKNQLHISFANNATGVDMTIDTFAQSVTKIKNWLANNNLHFAIPLETPQLIATLTPTQLKSLIGTNNIWSNANGNVEVKYWTH